MIYRTHILPGSSLLLAMVMAGSMQSLMAQQDSLLNRQVTISRDYVPEASAIVKLDCQPALEQPATSRSEAVFSTVDVTPAQQRGFGVMAAQQVIATPDIHTLGWVRLDMGNYWNSHLDAGLTYSGFKLLLNGFFTSTDRLHWNDLTPSLYGNYHFDNQLSLYPGDKWDKAQMMHGKALLSYDYTFFNNARLHTYVSARGERVQIPGSDIVKGSDPYQVEQISTMQRFGAIDAGVSYLADDWSIGLDYSRTGVHIPTVADHDVMLHAQRGWYDNPQWRSKLGIDLGGHKDEDFHFTALGTAELSYLPDPDKLNRLYLNARVGTDRPNLFDLLQQLPLLFPMDGRTDVTVKGKTVVNGQIKETDKSIRPYDNPMHLDLTLGFESNEYGCFQWGIYAGIQKTWNELSGIMMVHPLSKYSKVYLDVSPKTPGNQHSGPFMRLVNHDCIEFPMGMHMDYELNRYFSATIDGQFNPRSCIIEDVNSSELSCEAHLKSNPIRELTIDVSFVGMFGRKGTISDNFDDPLNKQTLSNVDLNDIMDLGVQAEYQILDNLSVYAGANNLLNRTFDLWPGIPGQKLNARLGFFYKF